ncbi:SDR family NAD(P)-dependent oxidoreductase [Nocardia sp. NPDC051929]|uniref:SDR family NAD(P)-dependent oxidoreductase n=1 Tax=unclassified Nocardia TaxID=2637762 RepID=UPI00342D73F4
MPMPLHRKKLRGATCWQGQHVIITGGSLGIGAAAAAAFSEAGARVSILARRRAALIETSRRTGAHWASVDVVDAAALFEAIHELEDAVGACDVIFCCAGIVIPGRPDQLTIDDIAQQMSVNYMGAVNAVGAVLPAMVARGAGRIVLTSSTAGLLGVVGLSGYCPTKAAVRAYAQTLRYELQGTGVDISVLYPPDTKTPGFESERLRRPPETTAVAGAIAPVEPDVVANALLSGLERRKAHIAIDPLTRFMSAWAGAPEALARPFLSKAIKTARAKDHQL